MKIFSVNKGLRVLFYSLILAALPLSALARAHASPKIEAVFQQVISGTVSDATGPLPGASIMVKGSTRAVTSDLDGKFAIAAGSHDVLVFSFTGFKDVEVLVGTQPILNITLQEDSKELKELTINAGYYTVKDKERTGSIARITAEEIKKQPVTNFLATMQGRMAGVDITQSTGLPGGEFNIRIRGINSIRGDGNSPLYIVDGVPYSSQSLGSGYTTSIFPTGASPLNSISPEAIQSIEVLKDADATAIYGSRGANGVVLITTKKGTEGKTAYEVSASTAMGTVTRFIDMMDTSQYLAMRRQAFLNDGITELPADAYDINGKWDQGRNTDWQKELVGKTAYIHSMRGSVSGGNSRTRFMFGENYQSRTTVFPGNSEYKKGGGNFNLSHTSADGQFSVNISTAYTVQDNTLPGEDLTGISRSLPPNAPLLYKPDGSLNWEDNTFINPLARLESVYKARTVDLITNAVLSYMPFKGFELKSSLGYTTTNADETRTSPSTQYNPDFGLGPEYSALFSNQVARRSWIAEPQASYSAAFGESKISALLGASFQQQVASQLTQYGSGFTSNNLIYNLAAATGQYVVTDQETKYRYMAFFGRLNYDYRQRYIVNLTARRDGSSRFGPGKQFATFGAIGGAWLFSKEGFLDENKVLSFGKLRASYGTTGSDQIGDYQFLDTYTLTGNPYQGSIGLQPTRLYNPDFSWEVNRKLEAALELGFFKDRIRLSAAWYRNRSSNQLVGMPMPGTTGFSTLQANLDATVENKGFEFTLDTQNINLSLFSWSTSFNISLQRNRLISFPGLASSSYQNQYRIGEPLNIQLVYQNTGVNPQTGLYTFSDLDGDGAITSPADQQKVVRLDPDFFGGLQNSLQYGRWNLDFLFQFVKQKRPAVAMGIAGTRMNQPAALIDSWMEPGDVASYQRYTTGQNEDAVQAQYLFENSDRSIVDGSFIRLKNISLSYDLPLQDNLKCRLYFQGQNLLTVTPYKFGDPEFAYTGYLPPLKVFSLGAQLNF